MHVVLVVFLLAGAFLEAVPLVTEAMIFPIDYQQGIYHVTENHPYPIIPKIKGDQDNLRKAPLDMVIELPRQVGIIRCCTRVAPQQDLEYGKETPAGGDRPIVRWRIHYPRSMLDSLCTAGSGWRGGFYCYLQAERGSAGLSTPVRYCFEQNGRILKERKFILRVLPELSTPRRKFRRFRLGMCEFTAAGHRDIGILRRQVGFWTALVDRPESSADWETFRMTREAVEFLSDNCTLQFLSYAMPHSTMILQDTDCEDLGFFDARHEVSRPGVPHFVDAQGRVHREAICPQYLMKDPEGLFYGEYIRRSIAKMRRHVPRLEDFVIDYEPTADGGTCDACLKDFADFAGLKRVPARREIIPGQPLNRRWKEYKIHQNRIIMDRIAAGVRKCCPGMRFSFCCTELRPHEKVVDSWDAVDVAAQDGNTDYFSFMNYCSGAEYHRCVKYAVDNLKHAKAYSWIDPTEEERRFFVRYTPRRIRQNIVATMALRAMGIMFYPMDTMDGQVLTQVNETCQTLASLEDIYWGEDISSSLEWTVVDSRKINVFDEKGRFRSVEYPDVTSRIRAHLHRQGDRRVCTLLNYSDDPAFIRLRLPDCPGGEEPLGVCDLMHHMGYSGLTRRHFKDGFVVEVPAGDASVILLSDQREDFPASSTQEDIQGKIRIHSGRASDTAGKYQARQVGIKGFQWRVFKKKIMPVLIHGENYVTIDAPENGRLEEWKCGRSVPVGQPGGTLSEVFFYDPLQAEGHEYAIKEIDLDGDVPCLALRAEISPGTSAAGNANPLRGLVMEKRYELFADGSLKVTDTFINPTSREMPIGFRVRSIPHSTWEHSPLPRITLNGQPTPDEVYCLPGNRIHWFGTAGGKTAKAADTAEIESRRGILKIEFPQAAGCYFWKSLTNATVEPLYDDFILKPKDRRSFSQEFHFQTKE